MVMANFTASSLLVTDRLETTDSWFVHHPQALLSWQAKSRDTRLESSVSWFRHRAKAFPYVYGINQSDSPTEYWKYAQYVYGLR